jgi:hypothetical protein
MDRHGESTEWIKEDFVGEAVETVAAQRNLVAAGIRSTTARFRSRITTGPDAPAARSGP